VQALDFESQQFAHSFYEKQTDLGVSNTDKLLNVTTIFSLIFHSSTVTCCVVGAGDTASPKKLLGQIWAKFGKIGESLGKFGRNVGKIWTNLGKSD